MSSYTLNAHLSSHGPVRLRSGGRVRCALAAGLAAVLALTVVAFATGCTRAAPRQQRPVIVLGIDGLEWRLVLELMRSGEMPNLAAQMSRGTYGRLKTLHPSMSPAIWTSVATGVMPADHGILGFVRAKNKLFTNRDRKAKA